MLGYFYGDNNDPIKFVIKNYNVKIYFIEN